MNKPPSTISDLPEDIRGTVMVIDALFDEIYLVGGTVRNTILDMPSRDLDFAVPNDIDDIESRMRTNHLLKVRTEGKAFGTIAASMGNFDIQVTTYRQESYEDGSRKPIVSSSTDIDSDLSRRDFTINAMALSREMFIDPYDGYADMKNRVLRVIGDPEIKFKEDPLRILRAFRFVSQFGYRMEELDLEAITQLSSNLQIVSSERQGEELKKLLSGRCWADALNELIEADVLNEVLKSFDYTYRVSSEDVMHEFEKYSVSDLEEMDIVRRWCYLINVLGYAEKAAGITSIDVVATAETLMNKSQVERAIKAQVIEQIKLRAAKVHAVDTWDILESMRKEITILKDQNDPKAMIEEAKYYTLSGRDALKIGKYSLAKRELEKSISITEKTYEFILNFHDKEIRSTSLRGITPFYLSRIKYYISAIILDEKLYSKHKSSDALAKYIQRTTRLKYAGQQQLLSAIDAALADVYRQNIHDVTLEPNYDFLNKSNLNLTADQKDRYISMYIEDKIRNDSTTVEEKSQLYLQKAKLAVKGKDESDYGLEYYDPYIDYLYTKMISRSSLTDFYETYSYFLAVIEVYIKLTRKERRLWAGERKKYLTSASSMVYALSLAKTIKQKQSLSKHIVDDYSKAGRGFEKNQDRYRVYLEWFLFVEKLLGSDFSESLVSELCNILKTSKSVNYVDIDEDYLLANRPDIARKRAFMKDSLLLLGFLGPTKQITPDSIQDPVVWSIANLLNRSLLAPTTGFTLYKNYVSLTENENIEIEQIELTDRELRSKEMNEVDEYLAGESETIEYKSTWSFDLSPFRATDGKVKRNNDDLKKEVVKNVAGLMNKRGGVLLIGVEDDGSICGLEDGDFLMQSNKDNRKKLDNIQLDIRNTIAARLSKEVMAELSIEAIKYDKKTIIKIQIPISKIGPVVYTDGDEEKYYVRSGTATENAGIHAMMNKVLERNQLLQR